MCLIAMMAIMGLSTSCLKEFDSVYSPGLTAAVCRELEVDSTLFEGDSVVMMATTRFGWVYEEGLSGTTPTCRRTRERREKVTIR